MFRTFARLRGAARPLSAPSLPEHLRMPFITPTEGGICMVVTKPWLSYPIAVVPPTPEVAPLIEAMRSLPSERKPFRIVSHETEDGNVFNAAFFDDESTMHGFMGWYEANALTEGSQFYECLHHAKAGDLTMPSAETLRFGTATETLSDSRFGGFPPHPLTSLPSPSILSLRHRRVPAGHGCALLGRHAPI